ncbi:MAG: ATP-binding protein [Thermomicrobiales bacterium]
MEALLVLALVSLAMLPFRDQLGVLNVLLIFLLVTFALALTRGLWPSVLGAILGFLIYDVVFIPPYLTLSVDDRDHLLALFVYLGVAIVTARLISRVREQTTEATQEGHRATILSELNAALIGDATLGAILARIAERVVTVYGAAGCRVLTPGADGGFRVETWYPERIGPEIDRAGQTLIDWAVEHRQPIGRSQRDRRVIDLARVPGGRPTHRPAANLAGDVLYLPILTPNRVAGILEVSGRPGAGAFHAEDEKLLTTFVDQAALALERARLSQEAAQAAVLARSDELKSALLAAVSHDLRTPLASIKAAATSLLDDSVAWEPAAQAELLTAIDEETDRLTLMVSNLLDLSRIEGGALQPRKDWYDPAELVADVLHRTASRRPVHPVTVEIDPDLPPVEFDYVEIVQVLINLLENAVRHTAPGTPVTVTVRTVPGAVAFTVRDEGPGIPLAYQPHIFERFSRGPGKERSPGSGIGLAICKGLVEAHGGAIRVESAPGAGAAFTFTLPAGTA